MSSTKFLNTVTGKILTYADSDLTPEVLTRLEARGLRPATPEDVAKRERDKAAETAPQQALALGEKVVRGVTLGQVEGVGSEEEIRTRAEVVERQSPILAAMADLAPDLALTAGVVASGGAALPALGVRGAARIAAMLGAEALTTGAVTASQQAFDEGRQFLHEDLAADAENLAIWTGLGLALGGTPVAVRALKGAKGAKAAKAAAETVEAVADAAEARALEKAAAGAAVPDGTVAAAAAEPTTVDLSMAAGIGLPPIRLTRRAARKVAPEAVREVAEETAEDGLEQAVRNATASEADDVVTRAVGGELEREAPSFARDRRLHDYRHEIRQTATRTMKDDLDWLNKTHRDLTDVATAKPKDIARNVGKNVGGQQAQARQIAKQSAEFAGQLRAEAVQFAGDVARAEGRKVGKLRPRYATDTHQRLTVSLMEHAKELQKAAGDGNSAKMFEAMDNFKRTVDDYKLSLEAGAKRATDPLAYEKMIPRVEQFAHSLRRSLEDANTWGRVGEMQAAYNRVWTDKFIPASRVFNEATSKVTGRDYQGRLISEAWENKLDALLSGADEGNRRYVNDMLDAMKEGAEARLTYGAATKDQVDEVVDRIGRIKRTLALGDEVASASRRMESLGNVAGSVPFLGGAARSALTGDLGSKLRTLAGASDSMVERSVDDWIRTSKVRARGRLPRGEKRPRIIRSLPPAAAAIAAVATRRGITHTMAAFMGEDEKPQAAFARWRSEFLNEEAFYDRVSQQFGGLTVESPAAMMAVSAHAAKSRQFLLERMPANVAVSMMNPQGYPPSRDAIEDWAQYAIAVTDPNSIMRSLARGDVTVQQAEVLKELYPRRFEAVQAKLIEKIAGTNDLDDQFLIRMNRLWELNGAGSVIFSPEFALRSGLRSQQKPKPSAPARKPPQMASRMEPSNIGLTGATYGSL